MCVIFNERFFDEQMDIVRGQFQGSALFNLLGEHFAHALRHTADELTIHLGKNFILLTREQQIG